MPKGDERPGGAGVGARMARAAGEAVGVLDEKARADLRDFVRRMRTPDGGFRGRGEGSDPYYSAFGLALWRLLGQEPDEAVRRYADSLGDAMRPDLVHTVAVVRLRLLAEMGDDPLRWTAAIGRFRAPGGGYRASADDARAADVYSCFLAMLAHDELGVAWSEEVGMPALLETFRRPGGGYAGGRDGAPIATVTGAALVVLGRVGLPAPADTIAWLWSCLDRRNGGFRASPETPLPDLLSTAVSLFALREHGQVPADLIEPTADYVQALWREGGGFAGHARDAVADVEYTWYGLLALGGLLFP